MSPAEFGDDRDGKNITPAEYAERLLQAEKRGADAESLSEAKARYLVDFIEANGVVTKADLVEIERVFKEEGGE